MMKRVIAIVGPTAVGKTTLSLAIAKALGGEIISCDSMQFYREMNIGTAKISKDEMEGIPHHLIDILDPDDEFSVALYQTTVREKIAELHAKNITPILVGGSGLYISSVLYDYQFPGDKREMDLDKKYEDYSTDYLAELLRENAPHLAEKTDLRNRRRILRALEKHEIDESGSNLYYANATIIALDMDRDTLYERINERVDLMMEQGLLEEVKGLYKKFPLTQAMQAIGYKELYQYLSDSITLEHAVEQIKKHSRHYAKRQLTWFRNKMECDWYDVDPSDFQSTIDQVLEDISEQKK